MGVGGRHRQDQWKCDPAAVETGIDFCITGYFGKAGTGITDQFPESAYRISDRQCSRNCTGISDGTFYSGE